MPVGQDWGYLNAYDTVDKQLKPFYYNLSNPLQPIFKQIPLPEEYNNGLLLIERQGFSTTPQAAAFIHKSTGCSVEAFVISRPDEAGFPKITPVPDCAYKDDGPSCFDKPVSRRVIGSFSAYMNSYHLLRVVKKNQPNHFQYQHMVNAPYVLPFPIMIPREMDDFHNGKLVPGMNQSADMQSTGILFNDKALYLYATGNLYNTTANTTNLIYNSLAYGIYNDEFPAIFHSDSHIIVFPDSQKLQHFSLTFGHQFYAFITDEGQPCLREIPYNNSRTDEISVHYLEDKRFCDIPLSTRNDITSVEDYVEMPVHRYNNPDGFVFTNIVNSEGDKSVLVTALLTNQTADFKQQFLLDNSTFVNTTQFQFHDWSELSNDISIPTFKADYVLALTTTTDTGKPGNPLILALHGSWSFPPQPTDPSEPNIVQIFTVVMTAAIVVTAVVVIVTFAAVIVMARHRRTHGYEALN